MARLWIALGFAMVLMAPTMVCAQAKSAAPAPAAEFENSKEFKETQDFIDKTQARIDQVRRETDARAKEIEAITNKVGEVISTMSSQGADNSSLRSEMLKLGGQLELEREISVGLRADLAKLNEKFKADQARRDDFDAQLRAVQDANRETEKRLSAALDSISEHARINRQLVSENDSLKKEIEQLQRENDLIRRLRSSNPSLPLQR